ncbi:phage tail tape measure protein [Streptomyces sp. V3I7]|uniref:phage tail tape measure protein n=1 Tax=Streptomyces sp. V3I7 TaxID=3042278 RepID=UPI002785684B|nr:phage tail tape measure protein [Streptomyces sp. V3I7]MDQ0992159.1 phage-related minor tail protein [Streptomyces sp. V3I7]
MSDTSLVFNLVARDRASEELGKVREKFDTAATGIAAGVAGALGVGVAQSLDMSAANAKLTAQLGVGPAEAAKLSKVSADVYAQAWGDSSETVNEAIKGVYQNIGSTAKAKGGLEGLTSKALALAEAFDQEVGPTTAAVGQMLKTGLAKNADEAFDILTRGFQSGANKADDLLDTINEYGTQWRKFGLDGQTAMGLLSQGLQAGARDADIVADAIKEFSIRAIDGSKNTVAGFEAIGLDAGTMAKRISKGGKSAADALDLTLDKLRQMPDKNDRAANAVRLFGTQAEDLGDALYALDPSKATSALGQVGGAADKAMKALSESPAKTLERFKRTAMTKLAEVSGSFLQFAADNKGVMEPLAYTLGGIAAAVLAVRTGMTVWAAAQTAWAAATAVATGAQWLWNSALLASPITWIILGIVALVAVIVLIATKTTWFQTLWSTVWGAVQTAISAVWNWIKGNWPLLLAILTGPIGLAVLLITKHWDSIKSGTAAAWNAVWGFVKSIPGRIVNLFLNWTLPGLIIKHWDSIKSGTVRVATSTVNWVKGLPGKITSAVSPLGSRLWNSASGAWSRFRSASADRISSAISLVRGLPGRARNALGNLGGLLYNSGAALIRGFISGIRNMIGSVRNAVSSVVSAARDYFPFSPAKVGPFSGKGWTLYSGQSLVEGWADGIHQRQGVAAGAMAGVTQATADAVHGPLTTGMAPVMGAATASGGPLRVVIDVRGADEDLKRLFRKIVRIDGRGSVQTAFSK